MLKHCLIVFGVSMVPLIELRGAIPYGIAFGLPLWQTYCIAIVGNMLPVPIIYFFARKVLAWGCDKRYIGKFFSWCLQKGERGGQKLQEKAGRGLFWALLLFVGIPLPGTGAWTGTLAASILDMGFKKSVVCCWRGLSWAACPFWAWVSSQRLRPDLNMRRIAYDIHLSASGCLLPKDDRAAAGRHHPRCAGGGRL